MNLIKINFSILAVSLLFIIKFQFSYANIEESRIYEVKDLLQFSNAEVESLNGKISKDVIPGLKQWAFNKDKELSMRWRALVLAAKIGGESVKMDIDLASRSSEWYMRSAAISAAQFISEHDSIFIARRLIKDKALVVRSAAVDIIGSSQDPKDREILWKVIDDSQNKRKGQSLWVRSQSLKYLILNPQRKEIPNLIKLLKENDIELQNIALSGLEKVSDFKFGSDEENHNDKRQRWLNWWSVNGNSKNL